MSNGNVDFDDVSAVLLDITDRTRKWGERSGGVDIQEALGRMNQMAESGINLANQFELERAAGELAEAAAMAACVAIGFKNILRNIPPSKEMH
ncbi:hypothetical protein ACI01nite_26500 [Acetobacter cibinongensis]|uniref:Uncharacterized protein n=1 Tax=Acetobacter cibinongensis TaxID=146475 RepID=A0A0D6N311_9PROT|nr:hypothetical protein [Acetobacter cibinongensis]GAN60110.1 hypothetical protein Abci_009_015 [Acetobacter cibinongensis]GBQ11694.1 hypothetical protein AA0482_0013 [Acetobacter cibinongensis NRIC 0482]GEL60048.1 hypothetical protein ACI01nite_26500 [Acetobacter cibinongensis]